MKTKLLLITFLSVLNFSFSQVIWTGGGGTADWNTPDNWSSNTVPTSMDDVEILGGFTVTINGGSTCLSLELKGNAILNIDGSFFSAQPSLFEAGTTVYWASGSITCSLLVNQGTMNLTSSEDKSFESSTLVNNNGTINIIGSGDLFLRDGTVLNNQINGTIDMRADGGNISHLSGQTSILNNANLIRRSTSTGEAEIDVELNNNGGIIQVDSGILSLTSIREKNLIGGNYVVSLGAVLNWDSTITVSGFLMGTIEGNLNWNNAVSVPVSATLNFTGSGSFNWTGGILNGGGVLTNQSALNLTTVVGKSIQEDTSLNNSGAINIIDTGDLAIQGGSIVNNLTSGVIDLQADGGNIIPAGGGSKILNNIGLIKRTTTTGIAQITVELNNNDGIIQVESGILSFSSAIGINLIDGAYNVSSGSVLDWDNLVSLSGNITGAIDGNLNWNNAVNVSVSATLNFTGLGSVNWTGGTLNGGGVLTNQSTLNLVTNGGKSIQGDTTLNNSGTINIVGTGNLFITQGIVNNQASGVIDMQAEGNITRSGGTSNILNNVGLIKRTTTTGIARIFVELNNSGTIEVETGELEIANSLPFTNEINGIIKGVGVFDLPLVANYTNDGVFAPGSSSGTLTVQGDYESTTNSVLDIELNGLIQDTEYDLLAIQGNASFNGDIQIALGFDAAVNDEFIVATTTGAISNCNLPLIQNAAFNGSQYEFSIECRNNNELVLTITNETLGIENFEEDSSFVFYPNPAKNSVHINNETITKIDVFDLNGRKVLSTTNSNTFSVKNLSKGIYIVKAKNANNETITKKLMKN